MVFKTFRPFFPTIEKTASFYAPYFGVDLSQGMNAMWGEYNVFGKVNHKKSEFGVSYYMGPRDFYGMYRDNEEEFHLADGTTLHRIEEGEPGHGSMFMNNLSMNYNLQQTENSLFSATLFV